MTDDARLTPTTLTDDAAGATMAFGMRLLLSVSALMTLFIAPGDIGSRGALSWTVFSAYALHSLTLFLYTQRYSNPFWHGRVVYWLDVVWYTLMVYCSGNSFFFPFFFFVILTTSFQWGFDEGARITLASAAMLTAGVLAANPRADLAHLLLRATFVLALGYMIAYWGGLGLLQRRRLGLLRDVSRLSNPRFGVDQTIASMLEQTRRFYQASNCVLLLREHDTGTWLLRSASALKAGQPLSISRMSPAAAAPLLAFAAQQTVLFAQALGPRLPWTRVALGLAPQPARWRPIADGPCDNLADLFDARAFISAPLPLRRGEGRIYVVSAAHRFTRGDAVFLHQLSAQIFPVIESIELLDRLASDAAFRERQKIARDLHDTAIQPYIGLRHGIAAMRQSADDNPLAPELDKLLAMTTEVIADMRQFARSVRVGDAQAVPELLVALRRQANQVRDFYGIDIEISGSDGLAVSDRLAAEVFQIVNEGMSNIRKHTHARHGRVTLTAGDGALHIVIENDNPAALAVEFLPGSIAERTAALGGTLTVLGHHDGMTVLRVDIPQ